MPRALSWVVEAVFAGYGRLVALDEGIDDPANGMLVVELEGWSIELRGVVVDGWWLRTTDASAVSIGSDP